MQKPSFFEIIVPYGAAIVKIILETRKSCGMPQKSNICLYKRAFTDYTIRNNLAQTEIMAGGNIRI
jgi:hypothetical protein